MRDAASARWKFGGKIAGQVVDAVDRLNLRSTPILDREWSVLATTHPTVVVAGRGDREALKRAPELREESEKPKKQGVKQS